MKPMPPPATKKKKKDIKGMIPANSAPYQTKQNIHVYSSNPNITGQLGGNPWIIL